MNNLNEQVYKVSLLFLKTTKLAKSFFWRRQVEKLALRLIEKAVLGNLFEINKILLALELLTKLGRDIQYIGGEIFEDLNREIGNLKSLINQSEEDGQEEVIIEENGGGDDLIKESFSQESDDLSKMQSLDEIIKDFRSRTLIAGVVDPVRGFENSRNTFISDKANFVKDMSGLSAIAASNGVHPVRGREGSQRTPASNGVHPVRGREGSQRTPASNGVDKSVDKSDVDNHSGDLIGNQSAINRQSAILEKVRQFGNCRMRDFTADFPDISERTLRNDLQGLCEKGLMRRIGNGGAYTFYTSKM